jgi:hypothetical protein
MTWLDELVTVMEGKDLAVAPHKYGVRKLKRWDISNTAYILFSWWNDKGSRYTSLHEVKHGIRRLITEKRACVLLRRHLPRAQFDAIQLRMELLE